MSEWLKTVLGEVEVGDIIDFGVTMGRVEVKESLPNGKLNILVQGARPVIGLPTEKCEVYR